MFLGLDHSWGGKPLLFETMVFRNRSGEEMDRYSTWDEAEAGHQLMCGRVFKRPDWSKREIEL